MGKHLSLSDRAIIEKLLAQDYTFAYIARQLKRSSVCISKEVKKHHVLIRRILPKGTSFQFLNNEDIYLISCHINSVSRELFQNKTPFDLMQTESQKKLLDTLGLQAIPPDDVILKPKLIKH